MIEEGDYQGFWTCLSLRIFQAEALMAADVYIVPLTILSSS